MMIPGYDTWRLRGPEEPHQIGTEAGQQCGRYPEPDEDQPRRCRPRPCGGLMMNRDGVTICESCGEIA